MGIVNIGCAIRNTGTGWAYIDDSAHKPIGVDTTTPIVVGSTYLTINYNFTADEVGVLSVVTDETFAGQYVAGASVGTTLSNIYIKNREGGIVDPSTITSAGGNFWINGFMYMKPRDTGDGVWSLQNSWVEFNSAYGATIERVGTQVVCTGLIKSGTITDGTVIGVVTDSDYLPTTDIIIGGFGTSAAGTTAQFTVAPNGQIKGYNLDATYTSITGLSWFVE